jgi:hypothetical protein
LSAEEEDEDIVPLVSEKPILQASMKASNALKIQKRAENTGPVVVKRPLTAYRNIGPSSTANSR